MTSDLISFNDFNLSDFLLRALKEMQFTTPTPIQAEAIPLLIQGRDVIGQAQTGTGKTAAFALPILQRLSTTSSATQALILAPTRELANQIGEQFLALAPYQKDIRISVLCGGQDYRRQLKQLRDGAQIVVGTPGRILDHITRGTLQLDRLMTFILDEADEMLRMGFIEDVEMILSKLPKNKQMALFSATMPPRIRQIATQYLQDPVSVAIRTQTATVKNITQRFLVVSPVQKSMALFRILLVEEYQGVIVFVRTKISSEEVAEFLQQQGLRATAIHGDLSQPLREKTISQFKEGLIDILVATDVAARGLDVDRVTHVINYDVSQDSETYVHRIGRTGRAGRSGVSILFVTPREMRLLNMIERHTKERIEKIVPPNEAMIRQAQEKRFVSSICQRLEHEHFAVYHEVIANLLRDNPSLSAIDVAAALALLGNQDKPWQLDLPKLSAHDERRTSNTDSKFRERSTSGQGGRQRFDGRQEGGRQASNRYRGESSSRWQGQDDAQSSSPQVCYRLEVGRMHGVKPGNIVGAIANEGGIASRFITGLQIHSDHSTVYLPQSMSKEVFHGLHKVWVCGRQLKLSSLVSA